MLAVSKLRRVPNRIPDTTIHYGLIWTLNLLSTIAIHQKLNNVPTSLLAPIMKHSNNFCKWLTSCLFTFENPKLGQQFGAQVGLLPKPVSPGLQSLRPQISTAHCFTALSFFGGHQVAVVFQSSAITFCFHHFIPIVSQVSQWWLPAINSQSLRIMLATPK